MATTKLSVTVDTELLDEVRRLAGGDVNVSAVIGEALRSQIHRLRLLALLNDMERTDPITPAGRAAGERLWQEIASSWTPAPSRPLPTGTKRSASRSAKR
jgi:hypothetical protein